MKGGITTYQVVDDSWETMKSKVAQALSDSERIVHFEAILLDSPAIEPERRSFTARVETIHTNRVPIAVDFIDEGGLFFQVRLDPDAKNIIFDIIS